MGAPYILTIEQFARLAENKRIVGVELVGHGDSLSAIVLKLRGGPNENEKLQLSILGTLDATGDTRLELFEGRVVVWGDVDLPS